MIVRKEEELEFYSENMHDMKNVVQSKFYPQSD